MNEAKLLPCPFCGSPAKAVGDASDWIIVCSNIKCVIAENWFRPDQWNTRAPDPLLEKVRQGMEERLKALCGPEMRDTRDEVEYLLSLFPPKPEEKV